ncbi:hypothetical protein VNO77_25989 [Canavalia gladiata]|uniref:Uncharacterized protein n=1 Tax=Canavalia gladiata TaxID=3824 RepID=A0AAN9KTH2_CANGL
MSPILEYWVVCRIGSEIRTINENRGYHDIGSMYLPSHLSTLPQFYSEDLVIEEFPVMAMLGAIEEVVVVVVVVAAAATAVLEDQEKGPSCVDQEKGPSCVDQQ